MKRTSKLLLSTGLAILALSACTKELPYKEQGNKFEDLTKASIDTKAEYLYSASSGSITRTSSDAIPYAMDENRRVRLEWTKEALRVLETERDSRFAGNGVNHKLVLEIPVEHVDYQCAKDAYGECTSREETRSDIQWNEKGYFKFKPEAAKAVGLSFLPIIGDKTLGGSCHDEVTAKVLDVKVESNAINISIERTFQVRPSCLNINSDLGSTSGAASVSAVFHYSMTKLDSLLSKDFRTVSYPDLDSQKFGFFSTERTPLGSDNLPRESGKTVIMNHWNPNRTEIVYYLSDEFAKPENRKIKEMTYQTVKNLNEGLKEAGVKFRINLKDPAGKNPGDNRNSMIVLVEDPVASGLLGYGPQVEDPVTGEIVAARTVMFLGTMKSAIARTYDQIREEKLRHKAEPKKDEPKTGGGKEEELKDGGLIIDTALKDRVKAAKVDTSRMSLKAKSVAKPIGNSPIAAKADLQKLVKDIKNYHARKNSDYNVKNAIENPMLAHKAHFRYLHEVKGCSLSERTPGFTTGLSEKVLNLVSDDSKPWDQLSDAEKNRMIDQLLPVMWIPTLIHEMGHNLGLRHNFQASEDKANFYTEQELAERGIEHFSPFTSVMEYAEDTIALTKLGKYDIAALRFGYNREVEVQNQEGKFELVKIQDSLAQMTKAVETKKIQAKNSGKNPEEVPPLVLKEYGYCTDEHTGINAGCRRFDRGTSFSEIVMNAISQYQQDYKYSHFRRDRGSFSLFGDINVGYRLYYQFVNLRTMQEVISKDILRFPDIEEWKVDPIAYDLRVASDLVGQFLMDVITTPDLHCVIAKSDNLSKVVEVIPLTALDERGSTCHGLALREPFVVIGQFGKLFNSWKDPKSENHWADQIDIRGYWVNKLMAVRAMFNRNLKISTLDRDTYNFADRPDIGPVIQEVVAGHLLNSLAGPQVVELTQGGTVTLDLPVETFQTQRIAKPLSPVIAKYLQIPDAETNFNQLLAHEVAEQMILKPHELLGKGFSEGLQVHRLKGTDPGQAREGMLEIKLGSERLIAGPENVVAQEAIARAQILQSLANVDNKVIQAAIDARKANPQAQPAADASEQEKYLYKLPVSFLESIVKGYVNLTVFEELLNFLPTAESIQSSIKEKERRPLEEYWATPF